MCVWITYMQWVWRTVIKTELTVNALNKGFGADTNVIDLLNWEMVKKNKVGFVMGMFAWYALSSINSKNILFLLRRQRTLTSYYVGVCTFHHSSRRLLCTPIQAPPQPSTRKWYRL